AGNRAAAAAVAELQRAAVDRRPAGVGIRARQCQRAGADLYERAAGIHARVSACAAIADHTRDRRAGITDDRELVRAEIKVSPTCDRAGGELVVGIRTG